MTVSLGVLVHLFEPGEKAFNVLFRSFKVTLTIQELHATAQKKMKGCYNPRDDIQKEVYLGWLEFSLGNYLKNLVLVNISRDYRKVFN